MCSPALSRKHSARYRREQRRQALAKEFAYATLCRHVSCFTLVVFFPIRSTLSMAEAPALAKATAAAPSSAVQTEGQTAGDARAPSKHARRAAVAQPSFLERLAHAAVPPDDREELRLQKSVMVVASVATALATLLWLFIYRLMGLTLPSTIPFLYLVLTVLF